jgi:uncharacterized protein with GYD domain
MASYINLINWTDQGIRDFRSTIDRVEQAERDIERLGVKLKDVYWTVGPYDIVSITEAPDDETSTAFLLGLGAQGNVRTTTLRAFDREEMRGIIAKLG